MVVNNQLELLKHSENIFYGDEIYIIPYHLFSDNNSINDMKKITVTDVETDGYNKNGCRVSGKVITYNNKSEEIITRYSGYAVYGSKDGFVVAEDGLYRIAYDKKNDIMYLTKEDYIRVFYKFFASKDLYINLSLNGYLQLNTNEEIKKLCDKINIGKCLLFSDRVECVINNMNVIFKDYSITYKGVEYFDDESKKELWLYMIYNEKPIKQNEYKMSYSKVFLLHKEGFFMSKKSVIT